MPSSWTSGFHRVAELTDEQIAAEKAFMEGVSRFNLAAFLLPPIWGPAHGMWAAILFYPAWLLVDNLLYAMYSQPSVMSVAVGLSALLLLALVTVAFALISQPFAWHRAHGMGKTKAQYLSAQRKWAVGCVFGALAMLVLATAYNLLLRVPA